MTIEAMNSSPDDPGEGEPFQPAVVEALISMDPHLSDFTAGNLVRRDGELMDPVEHINVLSATSSDMEAAKDYLALKREADLARYDAIIRLGDLIGDYDYGAVALSDVLAAMPPAERTEAEQILTHIRPATAEEPLTREQREAELRRLKAVSTRTRAFIATDHPLLEDGQLAAGPRPVQPIPDPMAKIEAGRLLLEIHRSTGRLFPLSSHPREITVTADEAAAKLDALEKRVTQRGDGTETHGDQSS